MRKATNPIIKARQESRSSAVTGTPRACLVHQLEVKHAKSH